MPLLFLLTDIFNVAHVCCPPLFHPVEQGPGMWRYNAKCVVAVSGGLQLVEYLGQHTRCVGTGECNE